MAKIKQTKQTPWKKSYDQPESERESHSAMSDSLQPHGLYSIQSMEFSRPEYWRG